VLESKVCGWGASGRNGGFLHGYWTQLGHLRKLFGDEGALTVARTAAGVVPAVRRFCRERGEDVWLREAGMLKVSASRAQDAALDRPVTAARDLGVPSQAQPLTAEEVAARCRSPRFGRGVLFPDAATLQPARLVRALRRAVIDAGGVVHEQTPVLDVAPGAPNVLETPGGAVRAADVVLATNTEAAGRRPFSRWLTNFGSSIVVTEPVPGLLEEIGWTGGEALTDSRMFVHYFRTTPDGRVVMGSGSGPMGYASRADGRLALDAATAARAAAGLRSLLPGLVGARIERAWGGAVDVSADHAPFFGTLPGTRVHFGFGYSGHGVGPAWMGGRILASLARGAGDEWSALPLVRRPVARFPPQPLRFLGGAAIRRAALACEEAEDRQAAPPRAAALVASIPRIVGLKVGTRVRE
jgi:glycine/D-amino acid oxidase-like deaminating enzyme